MVLFFGFPASNVVINRGTGKRETQKFVRQRAGTVGGWVGFVIFVGK